MKTFTEYLIEIYKPVAADAVDWRGTKGQFRTATLWHPHGTIEARVSVDGNHHDFSFKVNHSHNGGGSINKPHTLGVVKDFVTKAYNHYAQHELPMGHTLVGHAYDTGGAAMVSMKDKMYAHVAKSFADRSGGRYLYHQGPKNASEDGNLAPDSSNLADRTHLVTKLV